MNNISQLPENLRTKVEAINGCWVFVGAHDVRGYGRIKYRGRLAQAHRLAFHLLVDGSFPIFPGRASELVLDHKCRNIKCINPAHLESIDRRINLLRSRVPAGGAGRSPFFGVTWHSRWNKWTAVTTINGTRRHLGYFDTDVEAAAAYDDALAARGIAPINKIA